MKLLLTGYNRVGKTTLLEVLIRDISDKQGFITKELRKEGERIGFDMESANGEIFPLARVGSAEPKVGRYTVDIVALDKHIEALFSFLPSQLLYIDEIGQMQLLSSRFQEFVTAYLDADNMLMGTVSLIYKNEFIEGILHRDDVLLVEVTLGNRNKLRNLLAEVIKVRNEYEKLSSDAKRLVLSMARAYLKYEDEVYFRKLFKNAVLYVVQARVKRGSGNTFLVNGNTHSHNVVLLSEGSGKCDCDLWSGRGEFTGLKGDCSHIQAVKLFLKN